MNMEPLKEWETPEIVLLGNADEIIQGGGNCCYDMGGRIGNKEGAVITNADQFDDLA